MGIATTRIIRSRLDLKDDRQVTRLLFGTTATRALMASGFALANNLAIEVSFFWMASAMRQAFGPVKRAWLNRSLDSAKRVTLLSIDGQADALGQIAGGPKIGAIGSGCRSGPLCWQAPHSWARRCRCLCEQQPRPRIDTFAKHAWSKRKRPKARPELGPRSWAVGRQGACRLPRSSIVGLILGYGGRVGSTHFRRTRDAHSG